ncbi:MAG: hypothetical protein M1821_005244 [Bathelium mastoideum]|nr:MAG: hypothetical protein M1821_005244 [Bathelium mastoideum]
MNSFLFVVIYIFGGLTFLPLVVGCIYLHVLIWCPGKRLQEADGNDAGDTVDGLESSDSAYEQKHSDSRAPNVDVAAGYFAISRDFVPGGLSGKPLDRTPPSVVGVTAESPSVYQNMYRSVFERGKAQNSGVEMEIGNTKNPGKSRNVFFVVLRHGHLMLYDDADEMEVRHVIYLAHYKVDIYAGEDRIPEGDVFVKRNCIRLTRKRMNDELIPSAQPYFLFSNNNSEKEDFYHALLQNQDTLDNTPLPLLFESSHLVKLIQQLHESEENLQTRWFNAMLGRIFLALYQTKAIEDYVRSKISKKISRVRKPAFISDIRVRSIDLGNAAPVFTGQRLREMNLDGNLIVDSDVKYTGGFRLEITATVRIELGARFKPKEVSIILVGTLKHLEGHFLIRIKPPPTNRLWIAFETMPKMTLSVEPIVSSRQITYGVILRAIENKIREVVKDTLVLPNWDDVPFLDSSSQPFRGGIWARSYTTSSSDKGGTNNGNSGSHAVPNNDEQESTAGFSQSSKADVHYSPEISKVLNEHPLQPNHIDSSHPFEEPLGRRTQSHLTTIFGPADHQRTRSDTDLAVTSSTLDDDPRIAQEEDPIVGQDRPNVNRHATVSTDLPEVTAPPILPSSPSPYQHRVEGGKDHPNTSDPSVDFPSLNRPSVIRRKPVRTQSSESTRGQTTLQTNPHNSITDPLQPPKSHVAGKSPRQDFEPTSTAKTRWNWGVLNRQNLQKRVAGNAYVSESSKPPKQPMGRGQPLPPPGVPLPGPQKPAWSTLPLSVIKNKPVSISSPSVSQPQKGKSSPKSRGSYEDRVDRAPDITDSTEIQENDLSQPDPPLSLIGRQIVDADQRTDAIVGERLHSETCRSRIT